MTDNRSDATTEINAETAARHAPLNLGAGSYNLQDLERIGDMAVDAEPGERAALVEAELEKANQRTDRIDVPGQLPGHTVQEVERTLVEGVERPALDGDEGETEIVGDVTVTETIQVYDPERKEEAERGEGPAPFDATAFVDRNLDDISDADISALSDADRTAVRDAEAAGRNRSTLLARIDAASGQGGTGDNGSGS